jgi:hypothetical protein
MILKSKLNAKNKFTAIGALAIPLLTYSFDIINWRLEEIRKIDRKTTMILTMYLKRKEGGRGPLQTEATHKAMIINFAE